MVGGFFRGPTRRFCGLGIREIRFADDHSEILVFRRREIEAATIEVMAENGIPRRDPPMCLLFGARYSSPKP